jgi:hypothetical protein
MTPLLSAEGIVGVILATGMAAPLIAFAYVMIDDHLASRPGKPKDPRHD